MEYIYPYLFGLLTASAILAGGLIAFRLKNNLKLLIAFCGGALVTTSMLEVLPESIELTGLDSLPIVMGLTLLSFFTFLFLDKLFFTHGHSHNEEEELSDEKHSNPSVLSFIYSSGILMHTFIDGLIIGAGFLINNTSGIIIAVIILLHDFADGISTSTIMLKHKRSFRTIVITLIIAGFLTIIGIGFSQAIKPDDITLGYMLALFAGLFLYMGASDMLPEAHKDRSSLKLILATILGGGIIAVLSIVL